jgi:hypothetical protein
MTQNTNISTFFLFFNLIKNLLFLYLMFFPFLYFLRFFCICVINFEPFDYFWVTYERRVDHRMKDIFQYKWSLKQKLKKLEPDTYEPSEGPDWCMYTRTTLFALDTILRAKVKNFFKSEIF